MEWNVNAIIAVGALVIAIITLFDKFYGSSVKYREKIEKEFTDIKTRLIELETKIKPYWRTMEEHMVDLLKQPIHLCMDALLEKYKKVYVLKEEKDMSISELIDLKCELQGALSEYRNPEKKEEGMIFGYVTMIGIVNSRIEEKEQKLCGLNEAKNV